MSSNPPLTSFSPGDGIAAVKIPLDAGSRTSRTTDTPPTEPVVNNSDQPKIPPLDLINMKLQSYDFYKDYVGKQFIHLLDYYENGQRRLTTEPHTDDTYLGSFISTPDDNEDPTYMGFDFYIKWNDSPLFNGYVEKFIETYAKLGNSEIASRANIIAEFKKQFTKFIKVDSPVTAGTVPQFLGNNSPKSYYLKKVAGLGDLIESGDSSKTKQFPLYGTEFITLTFNEDVSQNLGYLALLYKNLSWSRINGKSIIPENLLRFDVEIVVTEARKMNRYVKKDEDGTYTVFADRISNYTYTLYECQFFFTTYPHGADVDNSAPKVIEDYEFKFNYKFSTLKFNKLMTDRNDPTKKVEFSIDQSNVDLRKIKSSSTNNSTAENGTIQSSANVYSLEKKYAYNTIEKKKEKENKKGNLEKAKKDNENKEQQPSDKDLSENKAKDQVTAQKNSFTEAGKNASEKMEKTLAGLRAKNSNSPESKRKNGQLFNQLTGIINSTLNTKSPTAAKLGNNLLKKGRSKLRSEIQKQAALLDKVLGQIKFR